MVGNLFNELKITVQKKTMASYCTYHSYWRTPTGQMLDMSDLDGTLFPGISIIQLTPYTNHLLETLQVYVVYYTCQQGKPRLSSEV